MLYMTGVVRFQSADKIHCVLYCVVLLEVRATNFYCGSGTFFAALWS